MTETFLKNYFKGIATSLIAIGHTDQAPAYYPIRNKMDLEEFDNAVRSMKRSVCLLVEMGSGNIADWDSQKETPRLGLHVLVKTASTKYDDIDSARDQAKAILLKIVSRMRLDVQPRYKYNDLTDGPLRAEKISFDTKITFDDMDGIGGNWYGKSFYFDFKAPVNLVYNPNDWTS